MIAKVMGSIPGPDRVCILEQYTLFHVVPVHSAENEYQLGVNIAIDRRPIQEEYCTLSYLTPLKEVGS